MKAFLDEVGRDEVLRMLEQSDSTTTSRLSYVECRSAFSRLERERQLSKAAHDGVIRAFNGRWEELAVLELDAGLARHAADLTRRYVLRASDAVHLASSLVVAGDDESARVTFACWDVRLWSAARAAGFAMLPSSLKERP